MSDEEKHSHHFDLQLFFNTSKQFLAPWGTGGLRAECVQVWVGNQLIRILNFQIALRCSIGGRGELTSEYSVTWVRVRVRVGVRVRVPVRVRVRVGVRVGVRVPVRVPVRVGVRPLVRKWATSIGPVTCGQHPDCKILNFTEAEGYGLKF